MFFLPKITSESGSDTLKQRDVVFAQLILVHKCTLQCNCRSWIFCHEIFSLKNSEYMSVLVMLSALPIMTKDSDFAHFWDFFNN